MNSELLLKIIIGILIVANVFFSISAIVLNVRKYINNHTDVCDRVTCELVYVADPIKFNHSGYSFESMPIKIAHTGSMCDINYSGKMAYRVTSIYDLNVGDIVNFRTEEGQGVVHRVMVIEHLRNRLQTKGDCNRGFDEWINISQVRYVIR